MAAVGITDAKIAGMKPPVSGQLEVSDQMVPGLRVRIGTSGARTFILRKRIGGRLRNITLGRYGPRFSLSDARKKARSLLVDIEAGKDPTINLATPRSSGAALGTVRSLWAVYLEREVKGRKRSAIEIERIGTRHILPVIGDRLADTITRADVTRLVEDVAYGRSDKPTPRMGRAVHQQLSAFYTWALPKLDQLPGNPCRDAGRPDASKARDRHLSQPEILAFWNAAEQLGWPFGPAFRLLLITAQRRSEVFEADRSEFSGKLWTIPATRAKNGLEHLVHVSASAWTILDALPAFAGTDKLFPARSNPENAASGFSKAKARLQRQMAENLGVEAVEPFTLHDLRRTAATGMQRLGIVQPVVEAVLNHVSGSRAGVAGIYQRHNYTDEKRHALNAWGAEVMRIVEGRDTGNVVPMRIVDRG